MGGEEEEYDPHLHRELSKSSTNNTETIIHLIKGCIGTGILALPDGFKHSGWLIGLIFTPLIGIFCAYSIHLVVWDTYLVCKSRKLPLLTYTEAIKLAVEDGPPWLRPASNAFKWTVDIFMVLYELGVCCVYIVFVAEHTKQIIDYYATEFALRLHMVMLIVPFTLIFAIPSLKILAIPAQIANVVTIIAISMIFYYLFTDMPSIESIPPTVHIFQFPLFFGTVVFSVHSIGVILTVENNMKYPKSFGGLFGVFNVSLTVVVVIYTVVGFFGYLRYGDDILGSVTLNIPHDEPLSQTIKILFSIAIWISYALQGYVPLHIIFVYYIKPHIENPKHEIYWEYFVRFCIIVFTFLLAIAIPHLGLFISLIGVFGLTLLGFLLPPIMDIAVWYNIGYGVLYWKIIRDVIIFIIGLLLLITGTYQCITGIIDAYDKEAKMRYAIDYNY